ncbi:hypothetical protein BC826DRAFT_965318 [Russula brevipes]|nr:hypothetical protein BC826DRAFT_965318 [Russula brevipes]
MRLPSSSSLLLASLASSSSISVLAAPSGDRPEDSSSVSLRSDDTTAHPNDHLQGRGPVDDVVGSVSQLIGAIKNVILPPSKDPKARAENSPLSLVGGVVQGATGKLPPIQMARRAEESRADSPSQDESASQAPPASAGPGNGAKAPTPPVNNIPPPIPALPVSPPSLPQLPAVPVKVPGRRDFPVPVGSVLKNLPIPPVQRELTPDAVDQ